MTPDDRRPFRGAPFDRGRGDRPAGPVSADRGERPSVDRPGFASPRPFVRPPTRGGDMPPPDHSVRIRDGEREIEVRGNPAFVRQVLDDLPALMTRLRGGPAGRTTISMPAPPVSHTGGESPVPLTATAAVDETPARPRETVKPGPNGADAGPAVGAAGAVSLEQRILEVLRGSPQPLSVAAIRRRLDAADVSGQQVRRLLERAGASVAMSSERPATYSLR